MYRINHSHNTLSHQKSFNGIDLVKFICAYMVLIIHISPFHPDAFAHANLYTFILQHYICRIAVPFFFTASGFLLFRKLDTKKLDFEIVRRYCFKILRLLGMWTVVLFAGKSGQLWYLGGVVIAVTVLALLIKKGVSISRIAILFSVFYLIALLESSYYGFVEPLKQNHLFYIITEGFNKIFPNFANDIFMGFVFVFLGMLFATKEIHIKLLYAWIGFVCSMCLLGVEVVLLKFFSHPLFYDVYISLIPATFFLFYISTHISLKNRPIYKKLRIIGMLVFYLHMFATYFAELIVEVVRMNTGVSLSGLIFLFTIIIVTALSVLIERLSLKYTWLKYLYS